MDEKATRTGVSFLMINKYPFQSEDDGKYYFWLGEGVQGPYHEYEEAHAELTAYLEGRHGKKESNKEAGK